MSFPPHPDVIAWRLHLVSPPRKVFNFIATNKGRASFWAESAEETDGVIEFVFPNGLRVQKQIVERRPFERFSVAYLSGSVVTFELEDDGQGGTDLTLTDKGVAEPWRQETTAGWASVLMSLKAAADFGVDLRNHDPQRTWDNGYVDN